MTQKKNKKFRKKPTLRGAAKDVKRPEAAADAKSREQTDRKVNRLPNSMVLLKKSIIHLFRYKKLFIGITFVYFLLTVLLVKGFGGSLGIAELKGSLEELFQGNAGQLTIGLTLYGLLVGSAGSTAGEAAGAYQSMVLVVTSLALIWALRQTYAGVRIGVKETFYKGLYPLVPFVLVVAVIGLQLIPLVIGSFMLAYSGLVVSVWEQILFLGVVFLLALLSLYWLTSSVFALYIVSLPDMKPLQSLRSAKELVRGRRWSVLRKLLFLPFILLVVSAFITVPVILFATPLAEWVFFLFSMFALAFVHGYLYTLYREML